MDTVELFFDNLLHNTSNLIGSVNSSLKTNENSLPALNSTNSLSYFCKQIIDSKGHVNLLINFKYLQVLIEHELKYKYKTSRPITELLKKYNINFTVETIVSTHAPVLGKQKWYTLMPKFKLEKANYVANAEGINDDF